MRAFIEIIIESATDRVAVPSFIEHVTNDLLDEIIRTGIWVDHGPEHSSEVVDQWDCGIFDYYAEDIAPEIIGKPFDEVHHTPEFRKVLHHMLLHRAEEAYDDLVNGSKYNDLPPLSPTCKLYRGISGSSLNSDGSVGVYWSQLKDQSLGRFINEKQGGYLLVAEVKNVEIDWYQTIRSRLNLSHGGDECEIQLKRGTPVRTYVFRVNFVNGKAAFEHRGYVDKKA